MTLPTLQIVIASTRPGRVGPSVAEWFHTVAVAHGGFTVELVDLETVDLPMLDEPKHPRLGDYVHQHTKDWSATIGRADAFVFVMPEYNYSYNAPLKNAIDYLHNEWHYKPVGFVSYGGIAAGTRAVQAIKQVVTALKMMPMFEGVNVPFVRQFLDADNRFVPNDILDAAAPAMLNELARWTSAMSSLRS
ncbi:MAG: hypothetical protein QOG52_1052 [Frankiaceae bacterium]|nr:hypothetical protein [Frankiaceae bacterium]